MNKRKSSIYHNYLSKPPKYSNSRMDLCYNHKGLSRKIIFKSLKKYLNSNISGHDINIQIHNSCTSKLSHGRDPNDYHMITFKCRSCSFIAYKLLVKFTLNKIKLRKFSRRISRIINNGLYREGYECENYDKTKLIESIHKV